MAEWPKRLYLLFVPAVILVRKVFYYGNQLKEIRKIEKAP